MEVTGWRLFQSPFFENQLEELAEAVEQLSTAQPDTYRQHPKTRLLGTICRSITETIPRDPGAPEFRQGGTLGPDNRHWFCATVHRRYRLFFRCSSKAQLIVYVWVNDESTLRNAGSRTAAYAVFKSMLDAGDPPPTLDALMRRAKELRAETTSFESTGGLTVTR